MFPFLIGTIVRKSDAATKIPRKVFQQMMKIVYSRLKNLFNWPDFIWNQTRLKLKLDELVGKINETFIPLVQQDMMEMQNESTFVSVMSRHLKNGQQLSFQEVYDNTIFLILAVGLFFF